MTRDTWREVTTGLHTPFLDLEQRMNHYDKLIDWILDREGGGRYTNRPNDRGGPTKWGITFAAYQEYLRRTQDHNSEEPTFGTTLAEFRELPEQNARQFFISEYINHRSLNLMLIPDPMQQIVILDGAVLYGRARAAKWAQAATCALTHIDGIIGPVSRAALQAVDKGKWMARVQIMRNDKSMGIVRNDPTQEENLDGWLNRTARLSEAWTFF